MAHPAHNSRRPSSIRALGGPATAGCPVQPACNDTQPGAITITEGRHTSGAAYAKVKALPCSVVRYSRFKILARPTSCAHRGLSVSTWRLNGLSLCQCLRLCETKDISLPDRKCAAACCARHPCTGKQQRRSPHEAHRYLGSHVTRQQDVGRLHVHVNDLPHPGSSKQVS